MDSSNNKYVRTHNENNKYKKKSIYAENDNVSEMNNTPVSHDDNIEMSNNQDRSRDRYSVDKNYLSRNEIKEDSRVSKQLENDLQKRDKISTNDIISRYLGKKVKTEEEEENQVQPSRSSRSSSERKIVNDFPVISDYEEKKRLRQARIKQRKMLLEEEQDTQTNSDDPLTKKMKWFQKINNEDEKSTKKDNQKTHSSNKQSEKKHKKREPFITDKDNIPPFSEYFDNMDRVNHEVTEIPSSYNPSLGTPIHHQQNEDDILNEMPKKKKFSWAFWRKNNKEEF